MSLDFSADQIDVVGFDLDDTLHFFKSAATRSAEAVFDYIEEEFGLPKPKLRHDYAQTLTAMQAHHFVENVPSSEYRSRRFSALLQKNNVIPFGHIDRILHLYSECLSSGLKLKEGAFELLSLAKRQNKRVVVITEGPLDAQRWTLDKLNLTDQIDGVFASSAYGCSKSDGLFEMALQELDCEAARMIFVGDNLERDYEASGLVGIKPILFDEYRKHPGARRRIESLTELVGWLEQAAGPVVRWPSPGLAHSGM